MVAPWEQRRHCPACGDEILLRNAPIINLDALGARAVHAPAASAGWDEVETAPQSVRARPLAAGDRITSRIDDLEREVLVGPPAFGPRPWFRKRSSLEPAEDAASRLGHAQKRVRRGCPTCHHPLPVDIDRRDTPVVVLLGVPQAGKTALLVGIHLFAADPRADLNRRFGMALSEDSGLAFRSLIGQYERGQPLAGTRVGRRPPVGLSVMRVGGSRDASLPKIETLHVIDPAGETCMDPQQRKQFLPAIAWASTLVVMVPPAGGETGDERETDDEGGTGHAGNSAGAMLSALYADLVNDPPSRWPTLIVCVTKVDRLAEDSVIGPILTREALDDGPSDDKVYNENLVRSLVEKRDRLVAGSADAWPGEVLWRAVAAMPRRAAGRSAAGPDRPWGITRLVDDVGHTLGPGGEA